MNPKWARVVCVILRHEWLDGRLAEKWARALVKRKSYHNRACTRCEVEEWNADEAERTARRVQELKRDLDSVRARIPEEPEEEVTSDLDE